MTDLETMNVPILIAISGATSIGMLIVWVFSTFESKISSKEKTTALDIRLTAHEKLLQDVARDVSFVRGKLEVKTE